MTELVKTKAVTGTYVGKVLPNGVQEYLGIRYAKPPVRWKRALPLEPGDQEINALEDGPACWQLFTPEDYDFEPPMSEDCLRLSIWTSGEGANKPVYVFIHGGSFFEGGNRKDCYGGTYCGDEFVAAHPDIVYVNIEYRFGPFGSMDLSAWDENGEYPDSNNLQILDQIEALKWIKANIAAFGGDPGQIAVGGQSAGCMSVFCLMMIPEAAKLFNKAICMSSAPSSSATIYTTKGTEDAKANAQIIANHFGAKGIDDLLALSAMDLNSVTEACFFTTSLGDTGYEPCRDDKLIPVDVEAALASGAASHISVLSGTVAGEFGDQMVDAGADDMVQLIHDFYPIMKDEDIEAYKSNYPQRDEKIAMEDLFNDAGMRLRQLTATNAVSKGGSPTYMYYVAFKPEGARVRAQHCADLVYISGKLDKPLYLHKDSGETLLGDNPDPAFGKKIQDVWYNFIKTGDPNGPSLGALWPRYDAEGQSTMVMDREFEVVQGVRPKDTAVIMRYAK